jgi:type II secretory pathway predicted ATPase ExeA
MYLSYFGLKHKPFAQVPQTQCLFPATTTIEALENLRFGLLTQHSISLLTAGSGLGKSLILQAMAEELNSTHKPVYMPTTGIPGRAAFLQAILFELKRPYTHLGEQELRLSLIGAARDLQQTRLGIVLLLDELHLADDEILMEIRTLTTYAELGRPLFSVIAAGQIELEDRLTHAKHAPFNQRIGSHVLLTSLSRQESSRYICHQIEWAEGHVDNVFTADAIELIAQVSEGIPRNINLICDQSLMLAYAESERLVDRELVEATLNEMSKTQVNIHLKWSPTTEATNSQMMPQNVPLAAVEMTGVSRTNVSKTDISQTNIEECAGEVVSFEVGFGVKQGPTIETLRQPLTSASTATIVHELALLKTETKPLPATKKAPPVTTCGEIEEFIINDRYASLDYERQLMLQTHPVPANKVVIPKNNAVPGFEEEEPNVENNEQKAASLQTEDISKTILEEIADLQEGMTFESTTNQFDVVMPEEDIPASTTFSTEQVSEQFVCEPSLNEILVREMPVIEMPFLEQSMVKAVSKIAVAKFEVPESTESSNLRLDTPAPVKKSRSFKNLFSKLRSQQ